MNTVGWTVVPTHPSRILHDGQQVVGNAKVLVAFLFELIFQALFHIVPHDDDVIIAIWTVLLMQQTDRMANFVYDGVFLFNELKLPLTILLKDSVLKTGII